MTLLGKNAVLVQDRSPATTYDDNHRENSQGSSLLLDRMKTATVLVAAAALVSAIDVKVSSENGIKASPLQYGMMFEDINASGDGGM